MYRGTYNRTHLGSPLLGQKSQQITSFLVPMALLLAPLVGCYELREEVVIRLVEKLLFLSPVFFLEVSKCLMTE